MEGGQCGVGLQHREGKDEWKSNLDILRLGEELQMSLAAGLASVRHSELESARCGRHALYFTV